MFKDTYVVTGSNAEIVVTREYNGGHTRYTAWVINELEIHASLLMQRNLLRIVAGGLHNKNMVPDFCKQMW